MKNIDIFVLAGSWPSWVQTTNYNQLSAECGFKVSSVQSFYSAKGPFCMCTTHNGQYGIWAVV